jgi:hypothetical protein
VVRVPDQAPSLAEALARLGDEGVIEVTASLQESLVVDTDRALVIRGLRDPIDLILPSSAWS